MKIIISHDQDSIEDHFPGVREALENAYREQLGKEYPEAEIEFRESNDPRSICVTDTGEDDPSGIEDEVQRICELVSETGNFWT